MAESVVKLRTVKRLDLRGDNRLPGLLDERELLKDELSLIQAKLKTIDEEVRAKLGDAQQMVTDGWLVYQSTYIRKAYTVQSATMQRMSVKRTRKRVDTNP